MNHKSKGIAPLIIVLLVALGLAGGATVGYVYREPIKKAVSGMNTSEEIQKAIDNFKLGQSKFELEGIVTAVNTVVPSASTVSTKPTATPSSSPESSISPEVSPTVSPELSPTPSPSPSATPSPTTSNTIIVKIKSSTNSIENLRLSETPIVVPASASIVSGSNADATFADILINSQVHVGGTIKDGVLTATKVIIQKEDATTEDDKTNDKFVISGAIKSLNTESITVTISSANKKAKDEKGQDLKIKISEATIIEKADITITLAELKVGDEIQVKGTVAEDVYTAANIVVKAAQKAGELEEEQNTNENQGNSDKNKEQNNNSKSSSSPKANSNSNKNQ